MMNLRRRLQALEKGLIREPRTLTMPDGSTVAISGRSDYLFRLFGVAVSGDAISPRQAAQLDIIRKSWGGGPMADVIRSFLHGPVEGPLDLAAEQK